MGFFSALWLGLLSILAFVWDLFTDWLFLWIAPIKNFEALWILIPIYIAWILTEFWQEKNRTSFGNAIANGVIPLWAGIDWSRYLVHSLRDGAPLNGNMYLKFLVCFLAFLYGTTIIVEGIRGKEWIHFFGRIREVSYAMIVFTPVIYDIIGLTWKYLLSIIVWFPLFYYIVQWIDERTPAPKSLSMDQSGKSGQRMD